MGFQKDLATGFAQLLAAATPPVGTWKDDGAYTSGQTGIILRTLPQSPDRVIVLAPYPVADDPAYGDDVIGLQITTRWGGGDPRPNDDLADRVFEELHGLPRTVLSTGIVVEQCFRRSGTTLGQDANSRWRTVQNFYVTAHRPTPHRS